MAVETSTLSDRTISELQRQEKYLSRLPADFAFPLFNAKQALESQRRSNYRTTAAAAREIVDNAIEAGAQHIHVIFDVHQASGRGQRKLVKAVAFIDDGSGMLPRMARYALSWGGGTHFDDSSFIGKFGFGLPNASINQSRRTEVFTRTSVSEPFTKARLDLNDYADFGVQSIPEPEVSVLPPFVQSYLDRNGIDLQHGTIVVWTGPDRLTYKQPAQLREHLLDDLGVTYRYLLVRPDRPLELVIDGVAVEPVDPLFLMPEARGYLTQEDGGAQLAEERFLAVRHFVDENTGARRLEWVRDETELDGSHANSDERGSATGVIRVRIARFPNQFLKSERRLEVRKSRRGMSFVRGGREIETVDAFPRSARDKAAGLGNWPLLQSYAYYWGVEVNFSPELDDVFGITNDKQAVRPIEDFWRVLAEAEIDSSLRRENSEYAKTRDKQQNAPRRSGDPSPAELAAHDADVAVGMQPKVPDNRADEARVGLELAAAHLLEEAQHTADASSDSDNDASDPASAEPVRPELKSPPKSIEEARQAIQAEAQRRPYRVDFYDSEDGPFYKPEWVGAQIVVWINRRHPFFQVLYSDLLRLSGGGRVMQAVDLLLITLAKSELHAEGHDMPEWYETQRKRKWSPYLETGLKSLDQRMKLSEEDVAGRDIAQAVAEADQDLPVADVA